MGRLREEEKWRPDRTAAPEGWLGRGRGSYTWRDTCGLRLGGAYLEFPCPIIPESLPGSWARFYTLRGPLRATLVMGL